MPQEIETPLNRDGIFEPQLIEMRQTRLAGMQEKILALYSKGMTTRDIEQDLVEWYGVNISYTVISEVTETVLEEARAWHGPDRASPSGCRGRLRRLHGRAQRTAGGGPPFSRRP